MGQNSGNYEKFPEKDTHNSLKCLKIVKMIPIIPQPFEKVPLRDGTSSYHKKYEDAPP